MEKIKERCQVDRKALREIANFIAVFGDTIMIIIGLIFAFWFRFKSGLIPLNESWWTSGGVFQDLPINEYFGIIGVGVLLLISTFYQMQMYRSDNLLRFRRVLLIGIRGVAVWMVIYFSLSLVLKFNPPISRIYVLISGFGVISAIASWRLIFHKVICSQRFAVYFKQRLVFVGWTKDASRISVAIHENRSQPYSIIGYVTLVSGKDKNLAVSDVRFLGSSVDIESLILKYSVDILILADLRGPDAKVGEVINVASRLMVKVKVISTVFDSLVSCLRLETISSVPILGISELPLDRMGSRVVKRLVDILGSLVGLLGSIPIFVVFGGLIWRESPGPIFFRQERIGRGGSKFNMLKLRSMRLDAANVDHLSQSTLRDDPRLLRIGAFIRRWNLDEVPQFYNVLIGEMSLVGPRPERTFHSNSLSYRIAHYNSRLMCKPGITGWAQINGLRGDTDLVERIRLDLYYLENWSIWLDLQIMVQTFFSRNNAY